MCVRVYMCVYVHMHSMALCNEPAQVSGDYRNNYSFYFKPGHAKKECENECACVGQSVFVCAWHAM